MKLDRFLVRDVSGQPFSAATLRSQPTSAIEHAGTGSHYIWEGKCHPIPLSESLWKTMRIDLAVANSRHFYRLVISYWLSVQRVLGFLERLKRPYSILTGAVDVGRSVGSGDGSGEDSKADVIVSGGSRRRSRSPIAKGFTKIASPPCDSSIIGAVPGGVPGTITSSSSLSSTGLDTVGLDTPWQ
jgi:hypothetical protein